MINHANPSQTPAQGDRDHDELGLEFGHSPVDLPEDAAGERAVEAGGVGWMLTILALSSVLLAGFNSFAIDKWARQLETTATTGPIKDAAARWHGAMQSLYLDVPLESGRTLWRDAKAARWSEDQQDTDPRR